MPSMSIQFHPQLNCVCSDCIRKCPGMRRDTANLLAQANEMEWRGTTRCDGNKQCCGYFAAIYYYVHSVLPTTSPSVVAVLDNYRPKRTRRRAKQRQSIKTFPSLAIVIVSRRGFTLSTRSRSRSSAMVIEQKLPSPQSGLSLIKAQ